MRFNPSYPRLYPIHTTFPDFPLHPNESLREDEVRAWESASSQALSDSLFVPELISTKCIRLSEPGNKVRILCESVCGSVFMVMTECLTIPKYECLHTRKQPRTCLSLRLLLTLPVFPQVQACCSWAFLFETSCTSCRLKVLATRVKYSIFPSLAN